MMTREKRRLLVTRWDIARALGVHAMSVSLWSRHEGLAAAAMVRCGGPGRPALYDGHYVVRWYNATKVPPPLAGYDFRPSARKPITLDTLRAGCLPRPPQGGAA
jgi:hypothetical protein